MVKVEKKEEKVEKINLISYRSEILILIQNYKLGKKDYFFSKKTCFFFTTEDLNELITNIRKLSLMIDTDISIKEEISSEVILAIHENVYNNYNSNTFLFNDITETEQFKLEYTSFKAELEKILVSKKRVIKGEFI